MLVSERSTESLTTLHIGSRQLYFPRRKFLLAQPEYILESKGSARYYCKMTYRSIIFKKKLRSKTCDLKKKRTFLIHNFKKYTDGN